MTPNTPPPAVSQPEKSVADSVLSKVQIFRETGNLHLPANYSAENAIKMAWLILQETKTAKSAGEKPVLEVCTKASIANALLKMILLGLNPAKRQCSFIAYGGQLTMQREYQGTIAIARRHGVKAVSACAVFKGDVFEFTVDPKSGNKTVIKHEQTIENIDTGVVVAAYATKEYEDGRIVQEVMTMGQIRKAWEQGQTKGQSPAHQKFPDEMAKKTVIGRLLKPDINSSDDGDLDMDIDAETMPDVTTANAQYMIAENANKQAIDFKDEVSKSEDQPEQPSSEVPSDNDKPPF